jgi:hypothetical protein
MTDEQLQQVGQRMKARMGNTTDVALGREDIEFSVHGAPKVEPVYVLRWGREAEPERPRGSASFTVRLCPDTPDELVAYMCAALAEGQELGLPDSYRIEFLPEITLQGPTAVVLNGHQLRIAELERAYTSAPRERLDPSQPYSEAEAEADVERVARALADYEPGGPWPDEAACVAASRKDAALLLSRLHGWKRGAPPSSPGHHHARSVFEGGEG